jgi:hypothetical protein
VGLSGVQNTCDRASVTITGATRVFAVIEGQDPVPVDYLALRVGGQVEVWFTGPVAESYPVQATADVVYAANKDESRADIFQVKDRHTEELMAIPGVVGVGIGGLPDKNRITVYLEDDSAGLRAKIPSEIEGFEVDIDVTGPIRPL